MTSSASANAHKRVIGIDLGTTNTLAAFADGRVPRIIPTERGNHLLPSVVAFVGDVDKPRTLIGHAAKEQLLIRPQATITGSKRLVGRSFHSPQVRMLRSRFAYDIVEGARGQAAISVNGTVHELVEVSAILLEQIARYAKAHLGAPVDGVVISVPAYYPLTQREAVRRAAEQAGLDVWRLVNEPTAAALAYGIGRTIRQKLLVFDLGGGTFDVSVLEVGGGTTEVLATGGDGFLGGVDFDLRLLEHVLDRFEADSGVTVREDPVVVQRILSAAEAAKIDLSLLQHVEVRLPYIAERRGRPLDLIMPVSRAQLVELSDELIERCIAIVHDVLKRANLKPQQIDEVLLAGGQTRMPEVQRRLEALFGRPPRRGVNPDEVVASGAALLARSLATSDVRLLDVLSTPIFAQREGHTAGLVVAQNAVLPADGTFLLPGSGGCVELFQGEGDVCEPLGVVDVEPLPVSEQKLRVRVDADGRLRADIDVNGSMRAAVLKPPMPKRHEPSSLPAVEEPPSLWQRLLGRG
jgi:molecular chaperone DnaK